MLKTILSLGAICALSLASPTQAADLIVNPGGKLTGANGVIVNGTSYNVTFVDGTCASVFGSCDSSGFNFSTSAAAFAAAQALLDQVLIDGPAGSFDSVSANTLGCSVWASPWCHVQVPYAIASPGIISTGDAINHDVGGGADQAAISTTSSIADLGLDASQTFARFVPSAVPEPSAWALMLFGLGAVGAAARRQKRRATAFA